MRRTYGVIPLLFFSFFSSKMLCQDTIVFENKYNYLVHVVEEHEENVVYTRPLVEKSPTFILSKRYVTDIRYQNPASAGLLFKSQPPMALRDLDVWVTPTDTGKVVRGELFRLNDTTLILRDPRADIESVEAGLSPEVVQILHYGNIYQVKARQRGRIRKYATWGAIGGFVAGTLTGLVLFKDEPPCDPTNIDGGPCDDSLFSPRTRFEKSMLLGYGTAGAGLLGGGIFGSVKVTIPIGGKRDRFNAAIPRLERLSK